ncbi:unnamed protein product, partial [Brachionus calyciflorus]
ALLSDILLKKISEKNGKYFIFDFNDDVLLRKKEITKDEKIVIKANKKDKELINLIIKKCNHLVGSFRHSESLQRKLKGSQKSLKYNHSCKLVQEVCTRWGSTYDLLHSIVINRKALKRIQHDPGCKSIVDYVPNDDELDKIEELCNVLQPLKELTTVLSAKKYVAINHLFPAVYNFINQEFKSMTFQNNQVENI